jgi:TonB family protein
MAAKNRPYEQFGPYILFKKLEADALGDLWRAGKIDGPMIASTVAVRRLTGGNRAALIESAGGAQGLVPLLTGTTFAKDQVIGTINGVPFVAHDYAGGRSLRHIIDRGRGAQGLSPNPIPIEQAIIIAEKIALSLATTADLRYSGNRLTHGALIPQFIWIAEDGEIRVGGQQLGKGIAASLADPKVAADIGRYFPPEYAAGDATKTTDVFSLGAILYLLVTGSEPPDASTSSAYAQAVRAAKTPSGQPVPDDIRAILDKSLALDPNARYASIGDMKQAISALAHGGKYSATTFNLAFYLSNLLKKEMESEAIDREKESKVIVAPYLEAPPVAAAAAVPMSEPAPGEPRKSKMPLLAIAAGVVVAVGAGAFVVFNKPPAATAAAPQKVAVPTPRPPLAASMISEPVGSVPTAAAPAPATATTATTATTASLDPAEQKKMFEAAVAQKMQEEMMKLQKAYTSNLQKQQSSNAPVQIAAASPQQTPALGRVQQPQNDPSAAALDERRLTSRAETQASLPQVQTSAPAVAAPQPQQTASQPSASATQPTLREGDVVDVTDLDRPVVATSPIRVPYPPLALQQRIRTTVIVTTLVDEDGRVEDVKVLKGDPRFGFNEAAIRALRNTRFTPPTKNGVRVKTWRPQPIAFAP